MDDKDSSVKCCTLSKSRNLHSIIGFFVIDPTLIRIRELSCCCIPYVDGN